MKQRASCGVIVCRASPRPAFLLLRHAARFDLPKGHMRPGETEVACAMRELEEETGFSAADIELDAGFRHAETYRTHYKRLGGAEVEKTVVVFLGRLLTASEPRTTEHGAHAWVDWAPPHAVQAETIDPLLAALDRYFTDSGTGPHHAP